MGTGSLSGGGGKAAGAWRRPPIAPYNTEVKERVRYLYTPSGSSWTVLGVNFMPFHYFSEPDSTLLNSSSVLALKKQFVHRFKDIVFQFRRAQCINISDTIYEWHSSLDCLFVFYFQMSESWHTTLAPLAVGRERRYVGIHQTAERWNRKRQVCVS